MTLTEKLASQAETGPAQQDDLWGNLGAGTYSALNEGLMGLPEFLVKNVGGSDNYKKLKEFQEAHKLASDVGGGIGTVGSLFIPGGAVARGAGLGLKALGAAKTGEKLIKGADFLKKGAAAGEGLGELALRGAGQAAEQAVPRALTGLDFTSPEGFKESVSSGLSGLPGQIATGAGAGALLGRLSQRLGSKSTLGGKAPEGAGLNLSQHAVKEAKEAVDNATLASTGLQTRAVRSASKALGLRGASAGKYGDDYVASLAKGIRDYGIKGKRQWEALVDKTRDKWDEVEAGFNANAPKGWNVRLADDLTRDPDLAQHIAEAGNESAAVNQLLESAVSLAGNDSLGTFRNKLGNIIKQGLHSSDGADNAKAQMAMAIKRKVDEFVEQTSGVDMGEAKGMYKLIQPFLWQEGKDIFTITPPLGNMGSNTAEKLAGGLLGGKFATNAVTGAGLGGASAASDAAQGQDVDWARAGMGAIAGGLLGPAAIGAVRGLVNKGASKAIRAAGGALDQPGIAEGLEAAGAKAPEVASKASGAIDPNKNVDGEKVPAVDPLTEGAKAEATEQEIPASDVKEVKTEMTDRFKNVMATRLRFLHDNYYPDLDPKDFMEAIRTKTKDFSDMTANADLLFTEPEQRAGFLREYNASLRAKALDIDKALSPLAGFNVAGIKPDEEGYKNREALRELLLERVTDGKLENRTQANEKKVDAYISQLQKNPALLSDLAQQLRSPLLTNLGVS